MEKRHKILEIEDIQTYYGDSHVIQGLSVNVYKQKAVSIIGGNGAGKTTTLRSIMGLTAFGPDHYRLSFYLYPAKFLFSANAP